MRILTNADDFGYDSDTVSATVECFSLGALTSATIMPKMPATEQAIAFAIKHPQYSFGLHLTFVCDTVEAPLSPPHKVPALIREVMDAFYPHKQFVKWPYWANYPLRK